jgi:hypothetical protein
MELSKRSLENLANLQRVVMIGIVKIAVIIITTAMETITIITTGITTITITTTVTTIIITMAMETIITTVEIVTPLLMTGLMTLVMMEVVGPLEVIIGKPIIKRELQLRAVHPIALPIIAVEL